jgi:hypothetical protein
MLDAPRRDHEQREVATAPQDSSYYLRASEPGDLTLMLRHKSIPTELFAFIGASRN